MMPRLNITLKALLYIDYTTEIQKNYVPLSAGNVKKFWKIATLRAIRHRARNDIEVKRQQFRLFW